MAVAFAACAYPEIQIREDSSSKASSSKQSSSMSSGAGGMGGMGGAGGMATSSSSQAGTAGGGAGGPECVLLADPSQCPPSEKCSLEVSSGEIKCLPAGNKPIWSKCFQDADCDVDLWCDLRFSACKPVCIGAGDCPGGGECLVAITAMNQVIQGIKHCTSNCQPSSGKPCKLTDGVTCIYLGSSEFDCALSWNKSLGSACMNHEECGVGSGCINDGGGSECTKWCQPVGFVAVSGPCGTPSCCNGFDPKIFHKNIQVGACTGCL
jgi:hypothetical protein